MPRIRSYNEIMLNLLDYYRTAQPGLDLKPGTVARDLFVEGPSIQTARVYDEVNSSTAVQSIKSATGIHLDRFGDNYNVPRKPGSKSSGIALLTFTTLDVDVPIRSGDIITGKNGSSFIVLSNTIISSTYASQYKAVASKFRSDLDFAGISDLYAVEVTVESVSPGVLGNISKYSLSTTNIAGVSHVINVAPFGGGNGSESDNSYRNRILAVFSGANTGTALGYKNAVMSDPAVTDAIVIGPGDPLMTRDGTQVVKTGGYRDAPTIVYEGSGGKVDVIVFGIRLQENTDSYIYRDLSNTDNPTNSKNDFVLGQISGDANKTVTKKRLDNIANSVFPCQPINNIIEVTGQRSGANFIQKTTDSLGRVSGNYELIRDTGAYAGSPWGFDKLHWISDRVTGFAEDKTKLTYNGQEGLGYTDVLNIQSIKQNIQITNENSQVTATNRSIIQLAHKPITNVTRVFNATTGERYTISDQNPSGGSVNTTGKITISGKSLPAVSDVLQVDYTWILSYDRYLDFDNKVTKSNPRSVADSVDWGFSNAVRREKSILISAGPYLTVTTTHPVSSVVNVNVYSSETKVVSLQSNKLSLTNLIDTVVNVVSITRDSDNAELWNTNKSNGTFSGKTIYFPTDSVVNLADSVTIIYNATDVYGATGSFSDNKITIIPSTTATAGKLVECSYIANISTLLPSTLLSSLPAIRSRNYFSVNSSSVGCQPTTHVFSSGVVPASNLRKAPTNLSLTISGSIAPGIITVVGTTMTGVFDVVYTVSYDGLKQDISSALKSFLSLSSTSAIPSGVVLAKVDKVEKVTTTSKLEVLSLDYEYSLLGCKLYDNSFDISDCTKDASLKASEFVIPSTTENVSHTPVVGDRIRISFHYVIANDTENVSFSKAGTLYTDKKFAIVDSISISSGFISKQSSSALLSVTTLNQPTTRSRYKVTYDYLGPKTNERITIRTNYDRLITDATLSIENSRPINADVLAKAASPILIDVNMKIIVTSSYTNSPNTVIQNVRDAITSTLNSNSLNTIIDSSDLVNAAYTVSGVDSARVIYFNKTGVDGSVLSISAQKNEYLVSNVVTIEQESR